MPVPCRRNTDRSKYCHNDIVATRERFRKLCQTEFSGKKSAYKNLCFQHSQPIITFRHSNPIYCMYSSLDQVQLQGKKNTFILSLRASAPWKLKFEGWQSFLGAIFSVANVSSFRCILTVFQMMKRHKYSYIWPKYSFWEVFITNAASWIRENIVLGLKIQQHRIKNTVLVYFMLASAFWTQRIKR